MLLAPQIMLNRFPTVQSNKSISGVMEEVDLWAIHGLYLIVTANPRFKASPSLTQSQEQPVPLLGAAPATAQNPRCGKVSGCGNIHTAVCRVTVCAHIYMVCVYTPMSKTNFKAKPWPDEKINTWWIVLRDLPTTNIAQRGCPLAQFSLSILHAKTVFFWSSFQDSRLFQNESNQLTIEN